MSCCRRSAFSATSSTRRRTRSAASPETNRRRSITRRVLHLLRADGICSQDGTLSARGSCNVRPDLIALRRLMESTGTMSLPRAERELKKVGNRRPHLPRAPGLIVNFNQVNAPDLNAVRALDSPGHVSSLCRGYTSAGPRGQALRRGCFHRRPTSSFRF
jgi:hypothetical protein